MIIRRLTGLAVAAGLMATTLATAASAAGTTTDLGVSLSYGSSSGDLAVGGGKVFVSAQDRIIVTNAQGDLTGSIAGLSSVYGLAAKADGSSLYAAVAVSNQVAEIDTGTLEIKRRPSPVWDLNVVDEKKTSLAEVLAQVGAAMEYEYYLGDSWRHDIVLEEILAAEEGVRYPALVDGSGACPPEDVGGIGGYAYFRRMLADPGHEEHDEYVRWAGRDPSRQRRPPHPLSCPPYPGHLT
ncbi:hypothetical protein [Nonomuraea sp. NPDC049400]|uniref:IS1096 element passenger TnpR family protein n=1 Tax=Nonomuraea sp. NPDC049400 TaxID=3364352 RepID=UPI00379E3CD0